MRIGVVGSGIVGSATGKGLFEKGFDVVFQDINDGLLAKLQDEGYKTNNTRNGYLVKEIDLTMIAVPTPTLNFSGEVDLSIIEKVAEDLGRELSDKGGYHIVCFRSTMPPGTTEGKLIPLLEKTSGKILHEHFGVSMNPEFLRAYNKIEDFNNPKITVLGVSDERTAKTMLGVYQQFSGKKQVVSLTEAETIKYANNLFNAAKISFFNEMWMLCQQLGIDPDLVSKVVSISAEACYNPEYGAHGGVPYGGTCLPKDTYGLLHHAMSRLGIEMPLLKAIIDINEKIKEIGNKPKGDYFSGRKHESYDNY